MYLFLYFIIIIIINFFSFTNLRALQVQESVWWAKWWLVGYRKSNKLWDTWIVSEGRRRSYDNCLRYSRQEEIEQGVWCYRVHIPRLLLSHAETREEKENRYLGVYWCVEVEEDQSFDRPTQAHWDGRCAEAKWKGGNNPPRPLRLFLLCLLELLQTWPEPVTEKVLEQSKMEVTILPKLPTTTGTPRKRRMASVLEAGLESMKTPPSSSVEASRSKTK
jgi:hypothetical protein